MSKAPLISRVDLDEFRSRILDLAVAYGGEDTAKNIERFALSLEMGRHRLDALKKPMRMWPGSDLPVAILKKYRQISPIWLLTGSGQREIPSGPRADTALGVVQESLEDLWVELNKDERADFLGQIMGVISAMRADARSRAGPGKRDKPRSRQSGELG